jgi:hypothetical protein
MRSEGLSLTSFGLILYGVHNTEKALQLPSASVGSLCLYPSPEQAQLGLKTKIPVSLLADRDFSL